MRERLQQQLASCVFGRLVPCACRLYMCRTPWAVVLQVQGGEDVPPSPPNSRPASQPASPFLRPDAPRPVFAQQNRTQYWPFSSQAARRRCWQRAAPAPPPPHIVPETRPPPPLPAAAVAGWLAEEGGHGSISVGARWRTHAPARAHAPVD